MKNLNRIVLGGVLGFIAPLTLAIGNETLFVAKQVNEGTKIWDALQICAFERRWFPLYPKVIHAPGCKNRSADALGVLLLFTTFGGVAVGVLSTKGRNVKRITDNSSATPEPTPQPAAPSQSNLQKPTLPSITPQVADGLQRIKGLEWSTIGKGAAVAGVVAIIGLITNHTLLRNQGAIDMNSSTHASGGGGGWNPLRQKVQKRILVRETVSSPCSPTKCYSYPTANLFKDPENLCLSDSDSSIITKERFEQMLTDGYRVVSTSDLLRVKRTAMSGYVTYTCTYTPYIVEGWHLFSIRNTNAAAPFATKLKSTSFYRLLLKATVAGCSGIILLCFSWYSFLGEGKNGTGDYFTSYKLDKLCIQSQNPNSWYCYRAEIHRDNALALAKWWMDLGLIGTIATAALLLSKKKDETS